MKYKVCELEPPLLDEAATLASGLQYRRKDCGSEGATPCVPSRQPGGYFRREADFNTMFRPSREWWDGGEIIEREQINLTYVQTNDRSDEAFWCASILRDPASERTKLFEGFHASPLVAAMRAFVASKLGDEIDLPDGETKE